MLYNCSYELWWCAHWLSYKFILFNVYANHDKAQVASLFWCIGFRVCGIHAAVENVALRMVRRFVQIHRMPYLVLFLSINCHGQSVFCWRFTCVNDAAESLCDVEHFNLCFTLDLAFCEMFRIFSCCFFVDQKLVSGVNSMEETFEA